MGRTDKTGQDRPSVARSFAIRPAATSDLTQMLELAADVAEAPNWTEAMYRSYITPGDDRARRLAFLVAHEGKGLLAFAAASCVSGTAELENLVVSAHNRRRGLGTALVQAVLCWAEAAGASQLLLEVRATHAGAIALYRGLGFERAGLRTGYYREPDEDAVVMKREVWQGPAGQGSEASGEL